MDAAERAAKQQKKDRIELAIARMLETIKTIESPALRAMRLRDVENQRQRAAVLDQELKA